MLYPDDLSLIDAALSTVIQFATPNWTSTSEMPSSWTKTRKVQELTRVREQQAVIARLVTAQQHFRDEYAVA